jgi:succinoglycan biosynthesis protein ExoM
MVGTKSHIAVCICTFKRPLLLKRLLDELAAQETEQLFSYSIVVVDNDALGSAESVVRDFSTVTRIQVTYCVESRQSIALSRNKAVDNALGDFISFIDDDEFPPSSWLLTLFKTLQEHKVDGVLGPVKPSFDQRAPKWVVEGGFYDRPTYPTGFVIDRAKGRTGNVLLKRSIFDATEQPFRPEFRTGEDQDFFGRMIEKGHVFIWCDEAVAYESVPESRWKRSFMLRRALLQGANSILHPAHKGLLIAKSIVAVPLYTAALPIAFLLGQHRFMVLLVKLFDHLGKLLAVMGVNAVKEYVTE